MYRVHFTSADIARTRIALLGPLAETQLSLLVAQGRSEAAIFDRWRATARLRLATSDLPALARGIAGEGKGILDLFSLVGTVPEMEGALDQLLREPRPLRTELALLPPDRQPLLPEWLIRAAEGDSGAGRRLARALRAAYQATVAPHWQRIHSLLCAERAAAAHAMAAGGVSAMLSSLHPAIRWQPPVLEILNGTMDDFDIHLEGRGMVVAPSVFCRQPLPFSSGDGEQLLIYPVMRDVLTSAQVFGSSARGNAVADLLGRTRAAVLETTDAGATTGQVASRLGISPASASQHATILREAGLVSSRRQGKTVRHTLTLLGKALLDGPP